MTIRAVATSPESAVMIIRALAGCSGRITIGDHGGRREIDVNGPPCLIRLCALHSPQWHIDGMQRHGHMSPFDLLVGVALSSQPADDCGNIAVWPGEPHTCPHSCPCPYSQPHHCTLTLTLNLPPTLPSSSLLPSYPPPQNHHHPRPRPRHYHNSFSFPCPHLNSYPDPFFLPSPSPLPDSAPLPLAFALPLPSPSQRLPPSFHQQDPTFPSTPRCARRGRQTLALTFPPTVPTSMIRSGGERTAPGWTVSALLPFPLPSQPCAPLLPPPLLILLVGSLPPWLVGSAHSPAAPCPSPLRSNPTHRSTSPAHSFPYSLQNPPSPVLQLSSLLSHLPPRSVPLTPLPSHHLAPSLSFSLLLPPPPHAPNPLPHRQEDTKWCNRASSREMSS